jgi:flagellar basal-body rod protein FlgB
MSDLFQGIGPLSGALSYHMERHNVLSSNVAHVDTPGYRPMEVARVKSQDFGQALSVAMTRTQEGHQTGSSATTVDHGRVIQSPDAFPGLDGNYVALDTEATKMAENQLRYEVVSRLTASQLKQLAYVAGDGR